MTPKLFENVAVVPAPLAKPAVVLLLPATVVTKPRLMLRIWFAVLSATITLPYTSTATPLTPRKLALRAGPLPVEAVPLPARVEALQ